MFSMQRFRGNPKSNRQVRYSIRSEIEEECLANRDHVSRERVTDQLLEPVRVRYCACGPHRLYYLGDGII